MNGATKLENPAWEKFAQLRARGSTLAAAWNGRGIVACQLSNASARSSGSRCEARPTVSGRIAYLRHQLGAGRCSDDQTSPAPISVMVRVSEVLGETYGAAKQIGAPESKLSRIRGCWSAHLARLAKMKLPNTLCSAREPDPSTLNVEECSCTS